MKETKRLLQCRGWESPALLERAHNALQSLIEARIGGDCWHPDPAPSALGLPRHGMTLITADEGGDCGLPRGRDAGLCQRRMLQAVGARHPATEVLLYAPPVRRASPLRRALMAEAAARGGRLMSGASTAHS